MKKGRERGEGARTGYRGPRTGRHGRMVRGDEMEGKGES